MTFDLWSSCQSNSSLHSRVRDCNESRHLLYSFIDLFLLTLIHAIPQQTLSLHTHTHTHTHIYKHKHTRPLFSPSSPSLPPCSLSSLTGSPSGKLTVADHRCSVLSAIEYLSFCPLSSSSQEQLASSVAEGLIAHIKQEGRHSSCRPHVPLCLHHLASFFSLQQYMYTGPKWSTQYM